MSKKFFIISAVFAILLVGCAADEKTNVETKRGEMAETTSPHGLDNAETPAGAAGPEETAVPETTADTDDPECEIMRSVWPEWELVSYGEIRYPGLVLSYEEEDGTYYRALETPDGIRAVDKDGRIEVYGPSDGTDSEAWRASFDMEGKLTALDNDIWRMHNAPNIMYQDVTGDGVRDLIFRTNSYYPEMGGNSNICRCKIVDGSTHSVIEIRPGDFYQAYKEALDISYAYSEEDILMITGTVKETGDRAVYCEENIYPDSSEIKTVELMPDMQYIYFEGGNVYAGFYVGVSFSALPDAKAVTVSDTILMCARLDYNKETGEFEPDDRYMLRCDTPLRFYSETGWSAIEGAAGYYNEYKKAQENGD